MSFHNGGRTYGYDSSDRLSHVWFIRVVTFEPTHTEQITEWSTPTLREALIMAQAENPDKTLGIRPQDYAQATRESVEFNEADGLLT